MQCPACQAELRLAERQGIEIDYCPQCRGVWLDRGELDKIIERATVEFDREGPYAPYAERPGYPPEYPERRPDWDDDDEHLKRYGRRPRRRRGFLDDIFDFWD